VKKAKGRGSHGKIKLGDFLKWIGSHRKKPKRREHRKHGWGKMIKGIGKI